MSNKAKQVAPGRTCGRNRRLAEFRARPRLLSPGEPAPSPAAQVVAARSPVVESTINTKSQRSRRRPSTGQPQVRDSTGVGRSGKSTGVRRSPALRLTWQAKANMQNVASTPGDAFSVAGSICHVTLVAAAQRQHRGRRDRVTSNFLSSVSAAPLIQAALASARAALSTRLSSGSPSSPANAPVTISDNSSAGSPLRSSPSVQRRRWSRSACRPSGSCRERAARG